LPERTIFRPKQHADLDTIPRLARLPSAIRHEMRVVASVLPFRVNDYVVDELIDWDRAPDDPMFRLVFPQRGMLEPADFDAIDRLLRACASPRAVKAAARAIQLRLNPHPAGQRELNVPHREAEALAGIQHKYRETVLFFPSAGQTCHAYCGYCFRWPQFVGMHELRFAASETGALVGYLGEHPEVTSVLVTGGDPLVMRTVVLRRYLEPLLAAELPRLASIRIGTKSVAWWPARFLDPDGDELLRLFEQVVRSGKTLALMAHYSHPRELETPTAQAALRRILSTGAVVRCQAPVVRGVNDDPRAWAELWRQQVRLGAVPYYMFVARDTGARRYYEVPLVRAHAIYRDALAQVSGLARTVRGPSMSATPGKVVIDGVASVQGESVFVLRFLQARDPAWVGRPFFARLDPRASWLDELRPAFGEAEFFWQAPLRAMLAHPERAQPWLDPPDGRRRLPVIAGAAA
jgi:L-lysine 2,3-aminomutase